MAPARPNKKYAPLPNGNPQGAAFFKFQLTFEQRTPLDGTAFAVFFSNDLGLNATSTVSDASLHTLFNDVTNNWIRLLTTYTYAEIYSRACLLAGVKVNENGVRAFLDYASKIVQFTIHGNRISFTAAPSEWAMLRDSVKKPVQSQTSEKQMAPRPAEPNPVVLTAILPDEISPNPPSQHRALQPQAMPVRGRWMHVEEPGLKLQRLR
ncbi:hypothetical protein GJ698_06395 [Pseudoduganella sp. FT26W]|uniref:Uncharacterized protein n=1 Tax=Duganella aquatilis TaxID=2666082 RepID=A0A844D511_9BURK|nr:hypothetical protein [Duganella aquatilis]MRW83722.1 hypothetical protein [Duganella aquatilis]